MKGWRLGCIQILEFVVDACMDSISSSPLVVCVETTGHRCIRAVSRAVFDKGVRVGQTLNHAWSICPELTVVEWCRRRVEQRIKAVVECLISVSPTAQALPGHDGCFMIDARGMSLLGGEQAFSERALAACASLGYRQIRMGIATQWTVAFMAVHKTSDTQPVFIVSEAEESAFVRTFSVEELACDPVVKAGLKLLGVRTLAQLLALPRASLNERFGSLIEPVFSLLDSLEHQTPVCAREVVSPRVEWLLEVSVCSTEHLTLGIRHLCVSLCARLMEIAHHTSRIDVVLGLDNTAEYRETIELTQPTIGADLMLRLVMGRFESERLRTLESPINRVVLEAHRLTPLDGDQMRLTSERWQPHKADVLLDRLRARCERPVVHKATKIASAHEALNYRWIPRDSTHTVLGAFDTNTPVMPQLIRKRLPSPLRVDVRADHENRPNDIYVFRRWYSLNILARTRSSGAWWSSDVYAFEDFGVQLDSGEMYWLRYLHVTSSWWLMGGWD